jgi:hypothetical protein
MDLAKIVRIVALVVAVVAGVVAIPQSALIIAVLGLVGGYFVEEDRRVPFMVMTLTLALAHILGSVSSLLNAGACTVIVMQIVDRLKA